MTRLEEIICSRIRAIPKDIKISINPSGIYSPDEILEHIEKHDEIGKKIIKIESEYFKFLKERNDE